MTSGERIALIRKRIAEACARSGRDMNVRLMAVTKHANEEMIRKALLCDIDLIGENRVQDAMKKNPGVEKHMIGHLQTNKVKHAVEFFDCIESVDSMRVVREISKRSSKVMPVFLQVHNGEDTKFGIPIDEVSGIHKEIQNLPNIEVRGLMGIAPHVDPEQTRPYFRSVVNLGRKLGLAEFSLGMTNDFEVAVEEGSTIVRLGRLIFDI